ncbi:DnaJ-domain-containing protein [Annulohypoxylon bovei var. microspora]|nr:DnaJ-domain-containing protein [Annulohypoxylon bovei var. microspora]
MANRPPDYYRILEVSETASTQQIRDAYKRAALKTHPDRVSASSPDRAARTRKFQLVNDAYYTLSDPTRRREYDYTRKQDRSRRGGRASYNDPFDDPSESVPPDNGNGNGAGGGGGAAQNAYSWAWNFFTGGNTNTQPNARAERQQAEDAQFGDVFEEMLREEGLAEDNNRPTSSFWSMLGTASGSVIGFIVGNMPGAVAGAVAGNRLGAVRDAKGKSVYAVFQDLPQDDRARLLAQLATRVFSHAVGI